MRKPLALVALLAAGCGGGSANDPMSATYQPQVVNLADDFAFQVTDVQDGSGHHVYAWSNGGAAATVDRSSAIGGGTVTLTIRDASGTVVHSDPLTSSGSVVTGTGTPGSWTIEVDFSHATGTVNFRVQKKT